MRKRRPPSSGEMQRSRRSRVKWVSEVSDLVSLATQNQGMLLDFDIICKFLSEEQMCHVCDEISIFLS